MARRRDIPEAEAARMREQRASPDEAQWRQYLGRIARDLGRGGVAAVARAAGVDRRTVARGKAEVEAGLEWRPGDRVRAKGAGRPSAERAFEAATGGDLRAVVSALVEASSYGDPSAGTRLAHTSATAGKVAREVRRIHGFRMSETTCGRVIRDCGYTRQRNRKIEQVGERHPMRDAQLERKGEVVGDFAARGLPIVSRDTKAKARLGPFAVGGTELRRRGDARRAEDHDFAHKWREVYPGGHGMADEGRMGANAVLAPYGACDVGENSAHVTLGTSSDTSEFAAGALARWWEARGRDDHPEADEVLLLLDGGGSNRAAGFPCKLELALAIARMGLRAVTVFHFPPGTSRHDPVERRLWSPMSRSWEGKPMEDAESAGAYVSATTTEAGLEAGCEVDWSEYMTEAAKERERKAAGLPKGPTAEQRFLEVADVEHFHDDPAMRRWNYRIVLK